jgi:predicted Fe-Mo cluster-binding NifX family protein
MRVAIAIWRDRISPVFDVSREILVLDIVGNAIEKEAFEMLENDNPVHKISKLMGLHVGTLICGAISNLLAEMIASQGIEIIPFTCGKIPDVINAFIKSALPDKRFSMPGCCGYRKQMCGIKRKAENIINKEVMMMPRKDGTGPTGQGPVREKGQGRCGVRGGQADNRKGSGAGCRQNGFGKKRNQQKQNNKQS